MARRGEAAAIIPDGVTEALGRTLVATQELKANLMKFLAMADPDVLAELPPLHRARALLLFAKSATALAEVCLRCSGISPDDHSLGKELERLRLYEDKLERFHDWNEAPLRPTTTLNTQAATRFIQHSLPDLSSEQRKSMRDIINRKERSGTFEEHRAHKRTKHKTMEKKSVRLAAQEFLEKAARELLGSNDGQVKGPLKLESSDGADD